MVLRRFAALSVLTGGISTFQFSDISIDFQQDQNPGSRPFKKSTVACFSAIVDCVWLCALGNYLVEAELSDTEEYVLLQDALIVLRLHCTVHRFKVPVPDAAKQSLAPPCFTVGMLFCSFKA